MLKMRTASTELTLGAFCCTQHSCKECRQIAFIGVTHNIYAKNLCYLSDKQLLLRLICLHSNVREAHHFPIWRQRQIQKRNAGRRACPLPEVHARRQERPLAECIEQQNARRFVRSVRCDHKMHRLRTQSHREKRRRARNHAILARPECAGAAAPRYRPAQTRDIQTADLVQHVDRVIRVGFVKRQRRLDHCDFSLQPGR